MTYDEHSLIQLKGTNLILFSNNGRLTVFDINTYQSVLRTSDDILFYFGYKVKELSNHKLICKRSRDCICILNANGLTIEQSFSVPKNITILGELNSNIILCQDKTTSYLLDINTNTIVKRTNKELIDAYTAFHINNHSFVSISTSHINIWSV